MDDSISFSKEKLNEFSSTIGTATSSLKQLNTDVLTNLNVVSENWEGDIKETAEPDFQQVRDAVEGINSNLSTIADVLSDKSENFAKVKYE